MGSNFAEQQMSNDWNDYPFSAFSAALRSAAGIGIGFILALVAGVLIGFYGHGAAPGDARDGFFFLYLFFIFPINVLANLGRTSGLLATLASMVLLILYFKWDDFKLEILVLYALSVGLCVFQSIGLSRADPTGASWLRFSIGCATVVSGYIAIRGVEYLRWKAQGRK
jgi:hypothetical protein